MLVAVSAEGKGGSYCEVGEPDQQLWRMIGLCFGLVARQGREQEQA